MVECRCQEWCGDPKDRVFGGHHPTCGAVRDFMTEVEARKARWLSHELFPPTDEHKTAAEKLLRMASPEARELMVRFPPGCVVKACPPGGLKSLGELWADGVECMVYNYCDGGCHIAMRPFAIPDEGLIVPVRDIKAVTGFHAGITEEVVRELAAKLAS